MPDSLKVMIVDDTITYRSILTRIVESIPEADVATTAPNGKLALSKLTQFDIDVVLLDIEMPEMNGLETLKVIQKEYPHIAVIMVSGMNRTSADITMQALEAGAMDFIPKPDSNNQAENTRELHSKLIPVFRHLRNTRSLRENKRPSSAPPAPSRPVVQQTVPAAPAKPAHVVRPHGPIPGKVDVIAIGVSTGGPNALQELIPRLPGNLGVPVLLVQHMPPVFTASLASSLDKKSALTVKEGEHGEPVVANTVYIAPGGRHMVARRKESGDVVIELNDQQPENSCRPAVDVLFRSLPAIYGNQIASVVLTGMGSDGAKGVQTLKEKGCYSIAQSESSCVVYGMPKAVVDMGLSDEVLDLSKIASRLVEIMHNRIQLKV
ncbi:MAG: chemotaxis response regulator protein-glutamate methylesterase [Candidatus Melainabacteria bacterium]